MKRQEATKVLRELMGECQSSLLMSCVSLSSVDPHTLADSGSYELHISCEVNDYLRKCLNSVLERHKLAMKESIGSVVIYRPNPAK